MATPILDAERATRNTLTPPPRRFAPLRNAAENLSRVLVWQGRRDAIHAALDKFLVLAYESSDKGRWVNIDHYTGAIRVPVPWSKHRGGNAWGLTRMETEVMRTLVVREQEVAGERGRKPLVLWSPESGRWYVDKDEYPHLQAAQMYAETLKRVWKWEVVEQCWDYADRNKPTGGRRKRRLSERPGAA